MATLSPARAGVALLPGLTLLFRGKVRDTYELPDGNLLVVATDGISIFDFVLNALVPLKGIVLNAINHFWLNILSEFGIKTHFVAAGADIDKYLPENLRGNIDLQSRAMVVRKKKMAPIEFIGRYLLLGSGKTAYDETGQICGHRLMPGLQDGDKLPFILDTPTTKAEEGHDEHMSADEVRKKYPQHTILLSQIFQIISDIAIKNGIILGDGKFELAEDGTVCDEVGTPDSCRFLDRSEWLESRTPATGRKSPSPKDKQLVRNWGIGQGINKLKPESPDDVAKAHAMVIPQDLIDQTTQTYRYIFWRLTGRTIEQYLSSVMHVAVLERPAKKVLIVCGSETDLPKVRMAGNFSDESVNVHVMSCHRNPWDVMRLTETEELLEYDVVIGVGGKALALPGIIDAWARYFDRNIRVAGVALGEADDIDLLAAQLSILRIPGQPVIFNEMTGQAYTGPAGLAELLERIESGELPPVKPRTSKPVKRDVFTHNAP